jgi:glutathione S-transferase
MALKIYGIPRSRAIRNVWACEEGGVPYDLVRTQWTDGGTKTPEFLRINPNGAVPALEDDGFTMFESLAMNLYIAKNKAAGLYPQDVRGEALVLQWTLWAATELEPVNGGYVMQTVYTPPEKRDPAAIAAAWAKYDKPLGVLDGHLAGRSHMLGAEFSIADVNVASILLSVWTNKADFSRWPHVSAWLGRCFARPAAQKIIAMRAAA